MRYNIIWSDSAKRYLKKLERSIAKQIYKKVGELGENPARNVKRLVGSDGYRLRIGDYRVLFEIDENKLRVLVLKVGHRKSIYK